tara:strand:- start:814 stop:1089 length:276 start_codon:yes stop_codon:yes gene_type:complete
MSRYYCPYCSSRYQFHKTRSDGVLVCGLCGDPLVKKTLINSRRIIGVVTASTFLAPLFMVIIFLIKDQNKEIFPKNAESLVLFTIDKKWEI